MNRKIISRWRQLFFEWLHVYSTNACRRYNLDQNPRRWSNFQLRSIAPLYSGDVVNISGWQDNDKEKGCYRDYFTSASTYSITNYWGSDCLNDGHQDSLFLDLDVVLPEEMKQSFDVVFTHTVLEHVFGIEQAVINLCEMSRDIVISVVPFIQDEHYSNGLFGDFWRFAPLGIERLMQQQGLEIVYLTANDSRWYPVYLFVVASRRPDFWKDKMPGSLSADNRVGRNLFHFPNEIW